MTLEAQRIAIAEAVLGGRWFTNKSGVSFLRFDDRDKDRRLDQIPDYPNDLNAMHEAEKALMARQKAAGANMDSPDYGCWTRYINQLRYFTPDFFGASEHATAAQRAEAFLRTLNLWQEDSQ